MKRLRVCAFVLVFLLALPLLPAAHAGAYDEFNYAVGGGNIRFSPALGAVMDCDESVYSVDIPREINGTPVTRIWPNAFSGCSRLASVTIPDTITSIGAGAFADCTALTSVVIPDSVTALEVQNFTGVFEGCTSLEQVTIPGSIQSLTQQCFAGCENLKTVSMGEGIEFIGNGAFSDCGSLEEIVFPDSVKMIRSGAMSGCGKLRTVTIGSGIESVDRAFYGCPMLESIYFRGSAPGLNGVATDVTVTSSIKIYYPEGADGWDPPSNVWSDWSRYYAIEPYLLLPETESPAPEQSQTPAGQSVTAVPTASTVLVNGTNMAFDAYNIDGANYFKLRDLAMALNGSAKQFEVSWDASANAIALISGAAYTAVGGELAVGTGEITSFQPTGSKIILDGTEISLEAYNINGNNYFKLRDIGSAFNFGVDWDGANNTVVIDTAKGYTPD